MTELALLSDAQLTESRHGIAALARLEPELARFEDELGVPLTSRAGWALAAFAADARLEPWTIVTRDRRGSIEATVVLAVRRSRDGRGMEVCTPRPHTDDELGFAARSASARETIVAALAAELASSPVAWTLCLTGLAPADPATALLTERLPHASAVPGGEVPGLRLCAGVAPELRKDVRRSLRRSHARLAADGVRVSTQVEDRPEQIRAALSAIAAAHCERDREAGRPCALDDRRRATFWREAIESQADRRAVERTLLRFDDELHRVPCRVRRPARLPRVRGTSRDALGALHPRPLVGSQRARPRRA